MDDTNTNDNAAPEVAPDTTAPSNDAVETAAPETNDTDTSGLPPNGSALGRAARAGAVNLTNVTPGQKYNGVEVPRDASYTDGRNWYNQSGGILPNNYRYANGKVNQMSSAFTEQWIQNMTDKGVPPMIISEIMSPYLDMSKKVQQFQYDQSDNVLDQQAHQIANARAKVDFSKDLAGSVAEAHAKYGPDGGMNTMRLLEQVEGPDAMSKVFPGYSANPQDAQKNYQMMLSLGAKAGTEQQTAQQTLELRPKELALSQAGLEQHGIDTVTNNYQAGLSAAAVARQADQTDSLLDAFYQTYQGLTRQGKSGTVLVNKMPAILQPLFQGQNTVNAQTLSQVINAKVGALNAALASTEGVRGAMGSDARAAMEQMSSGKLSLTKGDVEQNLPIIKNVVANARDVAKNKISTYNQANQDLINNVNKNGGSLNPGQYVVKDPTVKRQVSLNDLQTYTQKHNVSMGSAASFLKSQGYNVQGF